MTIIHHIKMDLTEKDRMHQVYAVQGDHAIRTIRFSLEEAGKPWLLPEAALAVMSYRRPDGTGGVYDTLPDGSPAWYVEEGALCFRLTEALFRQPGCVMAQIQLFSGEDSLRSFAFQIFVEEDLAGEFQPGEEDEPYHNWSQWTNARIEELLTRRLETGGFDSATFVPEMTEDGKLVWSNDKGKENPEPVDIMGMLMASAENAFLPRVGGSMAGPIDMDGRKIANLADPEDRADATTKGYADDHFAPVSSLEVASTSVAGMNIKKVNGIVYLSVPSGYGVVSQVQIPEGFRPNGTLKMPCYYITDTYAITLGTLVIESNGKVSVYNTNSQAQTTGWFNVAGCYHQQQI